MFFFFDKMSPSVFANLANNNNTAVEYEYALFDVLLKHYGFNDEEQLFRSEVIDKHRKKTKINDIIATTNISAVVREISRLNQRVEAITIETQNDEIGPADIVFHLEEEKIGISVKYSNSCSLNVSGRYFLYPEDVDYLKSLQRDYTERFIEDMKTRYGHASAWFRHSELRSSINDEYIGLIRDRVISNWSTLNNKVALVRRFYHDDSPIPFWIYEYKERGKSVLRTTPVTLNEEQIRSMTIRRWETSYVVFEVDGKPVGKMQVKFNNGILEEDKRKKKEDFLEDGIRMKMGTPFNSWNFSILY